ncbi:MAG: benzoate-CoA ligase family protein, partial [Acidobacteriaceae bacterium]|nr:benzoate-CoA ligase family protein [Acidobacteriaceae bacterium]
IVTYGGLLERTNRAGNVLRQLGVDIEQRVLLAVLDSPEFLYCFFGAIKIGAVAVPVNPLLKAQDYEYLLNDTRARVAIVSAATLAEFEKISPARLRYLKGIVVVGSGQADFASFCELMMAAPAELQSEPTHKDDVAFWLYSSGSTGAPKGCVHLHHDMVICAESYAKGILRMNESDRCYSVARLFFAYGLGNAGYFPLYCGATTILSPARPTPAGIFADIERYRPTLFFSVPTNYAALLAHQRGDRKDFNLSSVRHAVSAGESLPAPLFERFKQRFGVEILDAWGSTETLHMGLANSPGEVRAGSSGKIIPGYEAKITDDVGNPVPVGEIGQLFIKTDSTCTCYWNQHEKSNETFQGAWFRTGDKYYQDEEGYFWYAGRADDLFKVNGRWLSPTEVESALIAHPAVREAGVVGREDGAGLTKPAAFIVLNESFLPNDTLCRELQDWVGKKLSSYKRPQWIEYVPELPKTATGKLQRFKLRELQRTNAAQNLGRTHRSSTK